MYKNQLVRIFDTDEFLDGSVREDEINIIDDPERIHQIIRDQYLRDTTVTIVLLGSHTDWRKHIDWEIASSLRDTKLNSRSGLLGILLPTHPKYNSCQNITREDTQKRFVDNYKRGYAILTRWDRVVDNKNFLKEKINEAFEKRFEVEPDNSEPPRQHNRNQ